MARTSSAAVLAALIAAAPVSAVLAQTAGTTTETPAATAPVVVQPAPDAAADAASAANQAADTAAQAADATADAAAEAADAARAATDAATEAATGTTPAGTTPADAATDAAAAPAETAPAAPAADAPAADAPAADAPAADAPAADAPAADAAPADQQVGAYYTKSTHNAWTLRCLRTPDGKDPCELYQLLKDGEGKAVAEVSMIPFSGEAVAIMNFVAPLETDLEAGLGLQIDSGQNNRYPFLVCAPVGCVSRLGMTDAELNALKRGNKATLSLLPFGVEAANMVKLDMSLAGFTAGFTELQTVIQQQPQ